MVPSFPIEIAGSLPPSGRSSGVLEKSRVPGVVSPLTTGTTGASAKREMNRLMEMSIDAVGKLLLAK
jgi:hypothetical protein